MNKIEFLKIIEILKLNFGEKPFSGLKLDLIWKYTNDLKQEQFRKIAEHFVSSFKYPPLPKDFGEAAKKERYYSQELKTTLYDLNNKNINNNAMLIQLQMLGVNNLTEAVTKVKKMKPEERKAWFNLATKVSELDPKEWEQDLEGFKYKPTFVNKNSPKPSDSIMPTIP